MGSLGTLVIYASLLSIVVTIVAAVLAGVKGNVRAGRVAEYATYGTAIGLSVAVGILQLALITLDFALQYVIDYTSSTLNVLYRIGSMWAGQGGSLLLWAWLVSLCAAWITYANNYKSWGISSFTTAVFAVIAGLFTMLVAFFANPFAPATEAQADGFGLNPLLQDPLQIIHPLTLYAGYVLYTVPFAIIVGALIKGEVSGPWLKIANRWNVLSWIALTIGIVLGARWAYAELGWGGYWAWDPVENASLLPWLTGTILLHTGLSIRGGSRLRMAAVIVTMVTFNLCLFGTFLTRSGVISSVHAFGESNMGAVLGTAIALIVLACGVLIVWRLPMLRVNNPEKRSHGWLGQLILLILLVAITVAVLWGTMYPLFSRVLNGQEIAVTPGFFRVVVTPLGIAILGLFAISPLLPGQSVADRRRELGIRAVVFIAVFGAIMLVTHGQNFGVALVLALATLAIMTVVRKAIPRVKDGYENDESRVWGAIRATGPYVGHVGLVVLLTAVTFNVAFQVQEQKQIAVGQTLTLAGQTVRLDKAEINELPDRQSLGATISLLDAAGGTIAVVTPHLDAFANAEQLHNEVGIHVTAAHDVYLVIDSLDEQTPGAEKITITVYDNPAVIWLWIGGGLLVLGGILFAIPRRRRMTTDAEASMESRSEEDDVAQLLEAAIVAAKSGRTGADGDDAVSGLLSTAEQLSAPEGGTASQDDVVAFLEEARLRAGGEAPAAAARAPEPPAPATGGGSGSVPPASGASPGEKKRPIGLFVVLGVVVGVLALAGVYLLGHSAGSAVPGINGPITETAAASAPAVDPAKVAAQMEKISANPKDAKALVDLGDVYFNAGDYKNAIVWFNKALEITPKDAYAWSGVGTAAWNSGDIATAEKAFKEAIAIDPKDAGSHYGLGLTYLGLNKPDKAKVEWATVVKLSPDSEVGKAAADMLTQHGSADGSGSAGPLSTEPAAPAASASPSAS